MARPPRWMTDTQPGHSQWYIQRFRSMAADGADLAGEARFLEALVKPGSRVLDAGCGPGRLGAELHRRGHQVVGVDVDPALIEAAKADHPGPTWLVADLAEMDLAAAGEPQPFDAALLAGNVMTFLAPDSEAEVLGRVASHVRPGGAVAVGFGLNRGYPLGRFDADIEAAGLAVEQRFSTWDLRPFTSDSGFAVTVLRTPEADDHGEPAAASPPLSLGTQ